MTVPVLQGTATLNEDILVDSLVVDVIDGLRDELQPEFGIRAYRAYRVIRTWSGDTTGDGTPTDVAGEIRPYPRVLIWDGFRYNQAPSGLESVNRVQLREVSLQYAEQDLTGKPLAANQECFIALGDANGQGSTVYLFTHNQPPFVDREKDMGWVLNLARVQTGVPWLPS